VIRVASVPSAHPYVRALRVPEVQLLDDPPVPGARAGEWWPPEVLRSGWLRANAASFDLVHVHFGAESLPAGRLAEALRTIRDLDRPLVHTVHDLDHPHLADQARHAADLELLVGAAAELLTLTDHAADVVARRFGRRPTVVPHPQVAPDAWFARADALRADGAWTASDAGPADDGPDDLAVGGPRRSGAPALPIRGPVVGLHLRGLRANIRPGPWLAPLAAAVEARGGVLRVVVNDDVRPGTAAAAALDDFVAAAASDRLELVRRPRPDDDGLAAELAVLDVSVLPYAHGTHSGWLELCWDLGVRVLSPAVGAIADQHAEPWALRTFPADDPTAGAAALDRLLAAAPPPPAADRLATRRDVREQHGAAHLEVYRRALAGGPAGRQESCPRSS
jgi:hypothetical protein